MLVRRLLTRFKTVTEIELLSAEIIIVFHVPFDPRTFFIVPSAQDPQELPALATVFPSAICQ